MIKSMVPTVAAAGLSLLQVVSTPAQAGDNATTQMLLQALRASKSATAVEPPAVAARSGTFIVKAKFTRKTATAGGLVCVTSIGNFNNSLFTQLSVGQYAPLAPNGTCHFSLPYKWQKADTSTGVVVTLSLSNATCLLGGGCPTNVRLVTVDLAKNGPMPANGATTTYDFGTIPY